MHLYQPRLHVLKVHGFFLVLLFLVIPLLLIYLSESPASWYDEGLNINAAQTLAQMGVYGLDTGDGIRLADPAIQTGAPLIALAAAVTQLTGGSLFAIRLMIVIISLLTLVSLYAVAYRLYGVFAALMVVIVLLVLPPMGTTSTFLLLGRQFLGEIPAVFCISLGLHLLFNAGNKFWRWALIGFCWGLAIMLKSQVLLVLSVSVALWTLFRFVRHKPDRYYWLVVGIVMLAIYAVDTLWRAGMAGAALADNMLVLREGIAIHILPFRTIRNLRDPGLFVRFSAAVLVVVGLLWLRQRRPKIIEKLPESQLKVENFIAFFIIIWMIWYGLISIGWTRYSFVGITFTIIILSGISAAYWKAYKRPNNATMKIGLVTVAVLVSYGFNMPRFLANQQGEDFFRMAADLQTKITPDARIVSLEWAMNNFVPQRFIFPLTHTINVITENAFVRSNPNYGFDSAATCPDYVLLGSLSLDKTVLKSALEISDSTPLYSHGIYELYAVKPDLLPISCKAQP